jgi:hypothetical protein
MSKKKDFSDLTLDVFQCGSTYGEAVACGFNGESLSDSREECGHPLGDIEYAKRIAACVNACRGMHTEELRPEMLVKAIRRLSAAAEHCGPEIAEFAKNSLQVINR